MNNISIKEPYIYEKYIPNPSYKDWVGYLYKYDWDIDMAKAIINCESVGNPLVVNDNPKTGDYSVGLFQINLYGNLRNTRPSEEWLKNPYNNIDYAYKIYSASGWHPAWTCYNKLL